MEIINCSDAILGNLYVLSHIKHPTILVYDGIGLSKRGYIGNLLEKMPFILLQKILEHNNGFGYKILWSKIAQDSIIGWFRVEETDKISEWKPNALL